LRITAMPDWPFPYSPRGVTMPAMATQVKRVADLSLRERRGPIDVRVSWPAAPHADGAPVIVFLSDRDSRPEVVSELCRELCAEVGIVVLSVRTRDLDAATTAVEWTADHGAQLGADPRRLVVGGIGAGASLAAAVALGARDNGWPALDRQVLVQPALMPAVPSAGVAPATVVGAWAYARRLREAGVEVDEVARIADVATSLRRAMNLHRDEGLTNNHDDYQEPERRDC